MDSEEIKKEVRRALGEIASKEVACCGGEQLYSTEQLRGLPESVRGVSLGCGNPTALAGLAPGEVVLDLGSGGGIDVFLAAQRVGPQGRVIGLDMTEEMVSLARRNAGKLNYSNVEFRLGDIERMPIEDESIDVIISNCVINLSPDKDRVFAEAYRVLKRGGRMAISDVVAVGELPEETRKDLRAWVACIAGAIDVEEYKRKVEKAGFLIKKASLRAASGCCEATVPIDLEAVKPS